MKAKVAAEEDRNVKTTIELPEKLWRAAKVRALDDRIDFRSVVIAALEEYLRPRPKKGTVS